MTAEYQHKGAYLSSEFGEKFARDYFGDELIDKFSRFKKGDNKGQLKGLVEWSRCTKGGFGYNLGKDLGFGPLSRQKKHALGGLEKKKGKIVLVELFGPVWDNDCHKYINVCVARWYWEGLQKWSDVKALTRDSYDRDDHTTFSVIHKGTELTRVETLEGQEEDLIRRKVV
tara:strand:- start:14 stop:526 length:513 start_codon:yes stop_codon:yes gene_type:complete